jgi:radical SAM protein with 4Fe4S-binding SPASM domain
MFERSYIEISNICNLQCTFCPEVKREKAIVSVESFRRYAEQLKPLTKQVCLHLMGEPLGHPQFREITHICEDLNLRVFLTTNGTLLNRYADLLLNWKALDQINFSVHSYFANPVRQTLEKYLMPILNFCDNNLKIETSPYINLRLWNLAKNNIQATQNHEVISILNDHFKLQINEKIDIHLNKSKKILGKVYLHFDTEFIWPDLTQNVRSTSGTCYGLRKQIGIHANGDVVPCCLDKERVLKLGNINELSLTEILQSERAIKIKRGFEKGELIEELCQKCQYADRFKT